MAETVTIRVKSDVKIDEQLDISITGLAKSAKITLALHLTQNTATFGAHGHYIADSNGRVRLNEEPSVGGTYYGKYSRGALPNVGTCHVTVDRPTFSTELYTQ